MLLLIEHPAAAAAGQHHVNAHVHWNHARHLCLQYQQTPMYAVSQEVMHLLQLQQLVVVRQGEGAHLQLLLLVPDMLYLLLLLLVVLLLPLSLLPLHLPQSLLLPVMLLHLPAQYPMLRALLQLL
jgi:hypothetical protein